MGNSQQHPPSTDDAADVTLENLPAMIAGLSSEDIDEQLEATTLFRKLLSIDRNPPINEVVQSGVVPRFIMFLNMDAFPRFIMFHNMDALPKLQFEAAWALNIITSGASENTKVMIELGSVPLFVKLLYSPTDDVREQAVWALGNIARDSPECRNLVLNHGAFDPLLAQFNEHTKLSMMRIATWTLSILCRGKPQPAFEQTKSALPSLERLINSNDEEVLIGACWALSSLAHGTNDQIQAVIDANVCPRLIQLLTHSSPNVLIPALLAIGNIVNGDDIQTQCIIDYQALPCLMNLLTSDHSTSIKRDACWAISHITAGHVHQIQAVIDAGVIGPLVHLLQNAEFEIKKKAALAISNATSGGNHDQIKFLVSSGCIKALCDLLILPDPRITTVSLEGLENILKVGEAEKFLGVTGGINMYAQLIDEAEVVDKIEELLRHKNHEIYKRAAKIMRYMRELHKNHVVNQDKLDLTLLEKLKITMSSINKMIEYAEEKETTDPYVKPLLHKLKDAVYDTEDLFDVIATQTHENEVTTTPWNPFGRSLQKELEDVFGRMQCLLEQKDVFGLKPSTRSNSTSETLRLPTTSLVEQSDVYGRADDKEEIKNLLLSEEKSNDVGVIAIVGMGGLGKTTLAQFIFNHYQINSVFKLKVWICVAEDFDVKKITKTILEQLTSQSFDINDFDQLQRKLKEIISGKKFLIVLDDVWNENYMNWDELRRPFDFAAQGSKIIVTTRSKRVAFVMHATIYKLKPLPDEACWLLFSKHAFENIQSNSTFEMLGKKLVKKCGGLPLAAKVLGGLVGTKLGYEEWNEVLKSEIWDLSGEASDNNILPVLKLSYHHLPSNLKRCFAFCSIVPKDCDFEREKLVLLWMAENLLQDSKSKRKIDVGYEYLRELESRSLIQPASHERRYIDKSHGELHFSMHDLVNDLAKYVSGEYYTSFDLGNSFNVCEKTRYLSYVRTRDNHEDPTRFKRVNEAKRLRAFLPLFRRWYHDVMLPPLLRSQIWPQLNLLRSLTLARAGILALSSSIGNLKLLRYLDISDNRFNQLPESLASLYNLEMLNLALCKKLTNLPSKMRQLTKLNHLNIRGTKLQEMPLQMGRLKDLDVLTDFVVGKGSGSSIRELKELKYLRGGLHIRGLQNINHPEDALVANLNGKSYLKELSLKWDMDIDSDNSEEDPRIILENLRPHVNLKQLAIDGYSGTRLPDWLGHYDSFVNLVDIYLYDFEHCFDLSPLGHLRSLKSLMIDWCDSLVTLAGNEIPVELPNEIHDHVGHFSALVNLTIIDCPNLVRLVGTEKSVELSNEIHHHVGHFSALVYLRISDCLKLELPQQNHCFTSIEDLTIQRSCASLRLFPLSLFPKLTQLNLEDVQSIESLAVIDEANNFNLEYLESIKILNCPNYEYFNAENWCAPRMKDLKLEKCESLKVLPENLCIFASLLKLELIRCPNLEALPQSGLPNSLRNLEIKGCKKLIANRSRWGLQKLLSLSTFGIIDFECDDLEFFPEEGLLPSSLSTLRIYDAPNLRSLNGKSLQLLTCLEIIQLSNCPKLHCLPELPTSLSSLTIHECPLLESRCQREGEDWSKIAHIPNIHVYP